MSEVDWQEFKIEDLEDTESSDTVLVEALAKAVIKIMEEKDVR